jgi:hypothetical protein
VIVSVGIAVGLKVGAGVNVSVRVGVSTMTGTDSVGSSGVDGRFAHAPRPRKYRIEIPSRRGLRHILADIS